MTITRDFEARYNPMVAEALGPHTKSSPFASLLGIEVVSVSPGRLSCRLAIDPERHHSGVGAVHGGVIVALIDHVLSGVIYPLIEPGKWAATLEFKVSYLAPARSGELLAQAEVISLRTRLGTAKVDVHNGETHVASAMGTVYVRERLG